MKKWQKKNRKRSSVMGKMYRLAKELEQATGVQIQPWTMVIAGRRCFYFALVQDKTLWDYPVSNSVREALNDFYREFRRYCFRQSFLSGHGFPVGKEA